ncbi:MAG: trypsin-like peptidase domain-containing protein [Chloroflexi bacterium]|nr:trypsin-like peptidase domain-containing protein [Chloroflexota bacterium]
MSRGLAVFLVGALVGGIAGGAVASLVGGGPRGDLSIPGPTGAPATPPSAPTAATAAATPAAASPGNDSEVVNVVQELASSVVTVVTRTQSGTPGSGSGFVVDAQRGYVITNEHVVAGPTGAVGASFEVIFPDNRRVTAKLIGRDRDTDVAVLEVGAQNVKPLVLGNSDDAPIGARVIAIGSALGDFRNSVTVGVLSGKGRRLQSDSDPNIFLEDLIQTDAAISPGNSGGPLILAASRQVIGMNTLVIRVRGSEGLGFAVSSNTVRQIADELIKSGTVERGRIGILYQSLSAREAASRGLPANTSGVLISEVVPGSAGASAGLRAGDIVLKVNDQQIDQEHPLLTIMLRYRPGDKVRLAVFRDGREQSMEITLGRPT